jgi:hypothetical protein
MQKRKVYIIFSSLRLRTCSKSYNASDSSSFPLGARKNKGVILIQYDPLIFASS